MATLATHIMVGVLTRACEECETAHGGKLDPEPDIEPHCAGTVCDGCGSTLAGHRYDAHGIIDHDITHLDICEDCFVRLGNGAETLIDGARDRRGE